MRADSAAPPRIDSAAPGRLRELADRGRIQGNDAATVWVVEVSDFQCPYCKRFHDEIYPALKRAYVDEGKIRMAYINFPLRQHAHAEVAAEAAMCAAAQDRFWPMHDSLFATQSRWAGAADATAFFDSMAVAIGLDSSAWRNCVRTRTMQPLVSSDRDRAVTTRARTTPTLFIADQKIEGLAPLEAYRSAIERALATQAAFRGREAPPKG